MSGALALVEPRPTPAEALTLQLAMIAGRDLDARLEIRWRMPQGGMGQHFRPATRIAGLTEMALEIGAKTDLYVGAAPRVEASGTKRAVARAWCLWVDCDNAEAADRLRAFTPAPSFLIRSGRDGGLHGWWALRKPITAPGDLERALRRLAHHLGGDMACCDAGRIMRAAGTSNYKHGGPRRVEVERVELDVFSPLEVVGNLPDPPVATGPTARPPRASSGPGGHGDPLLDIAPTVYVEALTGLAVGRDGKVTCPFHADRTPSLHVYPDPARGWTCFGACQAGGTIIDFGAHLYGLEPRGDGYTLIRRRLAADLLKGARSA